MIQRKKLRKEQMVNVRLTSDMHKAFMKKAAPLGGQTFVLREMVRAFIEDRLVIQPPKEGTLYEH